MHTSAEFVVSLLETPLSHSCKHSVCRIVEAGTRCRFCPSLNFVGFFFVIYHSLTDHLQYGGFYYRGHPGDEDITVPLSPLAFVESLFSRLIKPLENPILLFQ